MSKFIKMDNSNKRIGVVVVGHSFVRRMRQILHQNLSLEKLGLTWKQFGCQFVGEITPTQKLSTLEQLAANTDMVVNRLDKVHMVVMDLGTNDLNNHSGLSPIMLADSAVAIAQEFLSKGVQRVLINEVAYRSGKAAICRNQPADTPVQEAEKAFNERVKLFNLAVKMEIGRRSRIGFIHQKGLAKDWRLKMAEDGTHYAEYAMHRYIANIVKGIIHGCSIIRGDKERQVKNLIS